MKSNGIAGLLAALRNKKYRRALPVYEFVKAEERYAAMAEKGWLLEKRGNIFERYRGSEPQKLEYRMEFRPVKALEGVRDMDEEELAVYEDCGWELVTQSGGVYVFSGTDQARDAELYTDKEGQLAFLKRSRKYLGGAGTVWGALLGCSLARYVTGGVDLLSAGGLFGGDWLFLLVAATFCYSLWLSVYGWYRCQRLVRLVKKGVSLRSEKANPRFYWGKAVSQVLGIWEDICTVGAIVLLCAMTTAPLPAPEADVPYLLLGEVFEGRRAEENLLGQPAENSVRTMRGLLSENYHTEECFVTADGEDIWLDQECYVLRFGGGMAKSLADSLLKNTAFAEKDGIERMELPGFDYAVRCRYAVAAAKGNRVVCLTGAADGLNRAWEDALLAVLEKWEKP